MDSKGFLGLLAFLGFLVLCIAHLIIGFHGLDVTFGTGWAYAGLIAAFFRLTPPLTVGVYFGAVDLWGWHPVAAAVFAAPGLLILIPGIFVMITERFKR